MQTYLHIYDADKHKIRGFALQNKRTSANASHALQLFKNTETRDNLALGCPGNVCWSTCSTQVTSTSERVNLQVGKRTNTGKYLVLSVLARASAEIRPCGMERHGEEDRKKRYTRYTHFLVKAESSKRARSVTIKCQLRFERNLYPIWRLS